MFGVANQQDETGRGDRSYPQGSSLKVRAYALSSHAARSETCVGILPVAQNGKTMLICVHSANHK
jgi:hypothetical protein